MKLKICPSHRFFFSNIVFKMFFFSFTWSNTCSWSCDPSGWYFQYCAMSFFFSFLFNAFVALAILRLISTVKLPSSEISDNLMILGIPYYFKFNSKIIHPDLNIYLLVSRLLLNEIWKKNLNSKIKALSSKCPCFRSLTYLSWQVLVSCSLDSYSLYFRNKKPYAYCV